MCLWAFGGFPYLPEVSVIKCCFSSSWVTGGKFERFFVHCTSFLHFFFKIKINQKLGANCWVLKVVNISCSKWTSLKIIVYRRRKPQLKPNKQFGKHFEDNENDEKEKKLSSSISNSLWTSAYWVSHDMFTLRLLIKNQANFRIFSDFTWFNMNWWICYLQIRKVYNVTSIFQYGLSHLI